MIERLEAQAAEAMLMYEMLKLPPLTHEDLIMWDTWEFLGQRITPHGRGFMDEPAPDLYRLKNIRAHRGLAEAIFEIRNKHMQQMAAVEKALVESGMMTPE